MLKSSQECLIRAKKAHGKWSLTHSLQLKSTPDVTRGSLFQYYVSDAAAFSTYSISQPPPHLPLSLPPILPAWLNITCCNTRALWKHDGHLRHESIKVTARQDHISLTRKTKVD